MRLLTMLLLGLSLGCNAQSLKIVTLVENAKVPWEVTYGPDNCLWWTERDGDIKKIDPQTDVVTDIGSIAEVNQVGEGGLMGLVFHPDYPTEPYIFVSYTYGNIKVKVVRYSISSNTLGTATTIMDDIAGNTFHDGCRMAIGPNEKLYIATGDAGNPNLSQNDGNPNGRILRLNLDGSIPSDNPIADDPEWARGLRNSQGLVWVGSRLYGSEHGPNKDDEVNLLERGRNYGWPLVNGFCDEPGEQQHCDDLNVREPLKAWTPTIAPAGMDYYPADGPIAAWRGCLLMTTLKDRTLYAMKLSADGQSITETTEYFSNQYGRFRDIAVGPNGEVYLSTSNRDGRGTPAGNDDRIFVITAEGVGIKKSGRGDLAPVPTSNGWNLALNGNAEVSLYSMNGRLQWSEQASAGTTQIPSAGLPSGLYLLTALEGGVLRRTVLHRP